MKKKVFAVVVFVFTIGLILTFAGSKAGAQYASAGHAKTTTEKDVDVKTCYECHDPVKQLHTMGKHIKVNCVNCHSGLAKHVANPGPGHPSGDGHVLGSLRQVPQGPVRQLHAGGQAPSGPRREVAAHEPLAQSLLGQAHGGPRIHQGAQPDPEPRDTCCRTSSWWTAPSAAGSSPRTAGMYVNEKGKVWDILTDTHHETKEHKAFLTQSAAAANPVCLQCKTQDQILKWSYLGDKVEGKTTWDRTSNVVEAGQGREPRPELLYLPRSACGKAAHRARRPDRRR